MSVLLWSQIFFFFIGSINTEKKIIFYSNTSQSLKVRVHQSLARSILNKHAAYRDNHLCIFLNRKFEKNIWQYDIDWKSQQASPTCCCKGELHPSFGHTYKKVEMTTAYLGEKTGLISWQLFAVCSQEALRMLLHGCGSIIWSSDFCACASMSKRS